MKASGDRAVMNARKDPTDALDDFPTPPFAARALPAIVLPQLGLSLEGREVWEPAAGRCIMAAALSDYAATVYTSDVHNYPDRRMALTAVGSFVGEGFDVVEDQGADWVVTNPPFNLALEFALRAIREARVGVALLCRSNWAEGVERYEQLFKPHPPAAVAQFVERVPMTEGGYYRNGAGNRVPAFRGGYDPEASTATAYSWFVWRTGDGFGGHTRALWIPPCRVELTRPDDAARFGKIKTNPEET